MVPGLQLRFFVRLRGTEGYLVPRDTREIGKSPRRRERNSEIRSEKKRIININININISKYKYNEITKYKTKI